MATHKLSRRDARRIAVRAQWLHRERPARLVDLVRHITLLQLDPTAAVAPSADLVAWSRLGARYSRADLDRARARGPACPIEPLDVGHTGEEAVVEGVKGTWRVDPSLLGQPFTGRAALLSPFDRLLHARRCAARQRHPLGRGAQQGPGRRRRP